jgi:hypothetical protein
MLNLREKQSLYRPGQALTFARVWGSHISRQSLHEGGKVGSPKHRPPLPTRKYSWYSFLFWAGWLSRYSDWLRDGRSWIESRWGRDFSPVQTGPGAHPASSKMGTGSFPGVKCGRGVLLTIHPLLELRSWKSRAIPLPTLWSTTACNGKTLPLLLPLPLLISLRGWVDLRAFVNVSARFNETDRYARVYYEILLSSSVLWTVIL